MTVHALQANFSRGAISPLVSARHDKEFYGAAVADLENFLVLRYGVLRRRSGTRFCGYTKYDDKKSRFIPFQFSTSQVFFIELGDEYARFWTPDGEQVLDGDNPLEIVSPYDHEDLDGLQFVQSGDVIFFAHPNYPPKQLKRTSNTSWAFSNVAFTDGPWLPINDTATTCDPSANPTVGGSVTLTFSSTTGINGGAGFTNDDIGRQVRVLCTTWCWFTITAVTDSMTVTATSSSAGASHAATTSWRLGAFAPSQGYPKCVEFFKGRLVWANTAAHPRALWLSMAQLPYKHNPSADDGTVADNHAFMVETLSGSADGVLWLKEAPQLQIGTASSIRTIGSNSNGDVFGPRAYDEDLAVNSGTMDVTPVLAGPSTVHVGRFGISLNDLYYDYQSNGLVAPDISALSEHLLDGQCTRLAYLQSPSSIIYGLMSDGTWVGATYDRYERVIGFHPHRTREGDVVEDICVAPNYSERRDVMIMIVRRTINTQTVRYVELLEPEFYRTDKSDAWFVDCGARYEGEPASTIINLDHLAGETVSIFADGAVYPNVVVSQDGEVEIPNGKEVSKALIGLPMVSTAKTLRPNLEGRDGPQHGLPKRTPYVVLDVFETAGLQIAPTSTGRFEHVVLRKSTNPMDTAPPLFTGTVRKQVEDSNDKEECDSHLTLLCSQPLPATIRALNVSYD